MWRASQQVRGLTPQDGVYTSALVTDDSVYFADAAGIMYCLDRETGKESWQVNSKAVCGIDGNNSRGMLGVVACIVFGRFPRRVVNVGAEEDRVGFFVP